MSIGIGTDIIEIERIGQSLSRQGDKLVRRILVPNERAQFASLNNQTLKVAFLAKRWCAKEAIAKALGTGIAKGVGFQEIEISHDALGAPQVLLHAGALTRLHAIGAHKALISISDERQFAVAFCTVS
ncbi:MAG: holo-ACP synthase [Bermanella sp.]